MSCISTRYKPITSGSRSPLVPGHYPGFQFEQTESPVAYSDRISDRPVPNHRQLSDVGGELLRFADLPDLRLASPAPSEPPLAAGLTATGVSRLVSHHLLAMSIDAAARHRVCHRLTSVCGTHIPVLREGSSIHTAQTRLSIRRSHSIHIEYSGVPICVGWSFSWRGSLRPATDSDFLKS